MGTIVKMKVVLTYLSIELPKQFDDYDNGYDNYDLIPGTMVNLFII